MFLWAWSLISTYVLTPVENGACRIAGWAIRDVRSTPPATEEAEPFVHVAGGDWIPERIAAAVQEDPGVPRPQTAAEYYDRYVRLEYLRHGLVVPLLLVIFILFLYLLGKLFNVGLGRWLATLGDNTVARLPVVRNVYSAAKQVTDFLFSERLVDFHRVVAVEYPRRGMWRWPSSRATACRTCRRRPTRRC